MKFLYRLFAPSNSLILAFDHLTHDSMDDFDAQISEVGKYYRFVKLSDIVGGVAQNKPNAMASVVFLNARKSLMLRAYPRLRDQQIPVHVFLRPDCVGLNRLPPEEELAIFKDHYGDRIDDKITGPLVAGQRENPGPLDDYLGKLRTEVGPFPVEQLDPTRFFSTWGKILEHSPESLTLGVTVATDPTRSEQLGEWLKFISERADRPVTIGYSETPVSPDATWPARHGLTAVVTNCDGEVKRGTSLYALPIWRFARAPVPA